MADSTPVTVNGCRDDAAVAAVLRQRGNGADADGGRESAALAALAQQLADDAPALLQRVAELARELCGADSVVLALHDPHGQDGDADGNDVDAA